MGAYESSAPAPTWEQGVIVGGGTVGALVYGPADSQVLSISHERFFLPLNPTPPAPLVARELADIRDAVRRGDDVRAGELFDRAATASGFDDGLVWTNPLGMCAHLRVRSAAAPGATVRRQIDLDRGEVSLEWELADGAPVGMRLIAPRDGQSVWLQFEAPRGARLALDLGLDREAAIAGFMGAPDGARAVTVDLAPGDTGRVRATASGPETTRTVTSTIEGASHWTADETGAQLSTVLDLPPGSSALLRITTQVDGEAPPRPMGDVGWEELSRKQAATHGELVNRSRLWLRGSETRPTTEDLWAAAKSGDVGARRAVVELAYLSGRANIISATGDLPATLQGVWQGTWTPAWSADYTLNGTVMNGGLASLIPTGTPELAASLLRLVLPHLGDYRTNAANIYGARGMLLPSRMSDHGRANHFSSVFPHVFWTGCGGWVLRVVADLVSTTGDRSIVDDQVWELVLGVLDFAESALPPSDGTRHIIPGYSPENTPAGSGLPIASDPTMDVAILRDAARAVRVLAAARGDHSLIERWDRLAAQLPAYRVADDGTLAEWLDDHWPENHAHRHVSQLYPLWYEVDDAFLGDADEAQALRRAALATVARKIAWRAVDPTPPPGRMEMAFGLVQVGLAAAALGDAESALRCVEWLAVDHWTPALTTTHDAGRIFNLDASGGLPAVVAAMLLGSRSDSVTLLPALPDAWRSGGSVTGLTGRGGVVLDRLEWSADGASATLRRRPEAGWLRPDGGLVVRVGSRFRFADGSHELRVDLGDEPLELRLTSA